MSRSCRRFPVNKDRTNTKKRRFKPKTFAGRAVRRSDVRSGKGAYRRYFCSLIISDYCILGERDEKELRRRRDNGDSYLRRYFNSYEDAYRSWLKTYKRK